MNNTDKDNLLNSLKQMNKEFNPDSPQSYRGLMRLIEYVMSCNETDKDILAIVGEMMDKAINQGDESCGCDYTTPPNQPNDSPHRGVKEMEFDIDFDQDHPERHVNQKSSFGDDPDAPMQIDWDDLRRTYYQRGEINYNPYFSEISHRDWHSFPRAVQKILSYRLACPQSREKNYHIFER